MESEKLYANMLFDKELPDGAFRFFFEFLAYKPNAIHEVWMVSQVDLAKMLGMHCRTVRHHLRALERRGYIRIYKNGKLSKGYEVLCDSLPQREDQNQFLGNKGNY